MNLQELCCTFEQAKRLRELGIKEHAYFHWGYGSGPERIITLHSHPMSDDPRTATRFESVPAYTSQELGAIISDKTLYLQQNFHIGGIEFIFDTETKAANAFLSKTLNEAQARAEFLIHLLEK